MPTMHGSKDDGTPITDAMVEAMADQAEAGYDVDENPPASATRPTADGICSGPRRIGSSGPGTKA